MGINISIDKALAIGIFFLMLGAFIVPQWNTALSDWNATSTGVTSAVMGGILLIVFLIYVFKGSGKGRA